MHWHLGLSSSSSCFLTPLDKDGDPVLESELDLEGGVTRQVIISFLETFEISLSRFATWIGFQ